MTKEISLFIVFPLPSAVALIFQNHESVFDFKIPNIIHYNNIEFSVLKIHLSMGKQ